MKNSAKNFYSTSEYKFYVGQAVRLKHKHKTGDNEIFQITGIMPLKGNSPQYRVKNLREAHERVTTEELIEAVSSKFSIEIEATSSPAFREITKITVPSRRGSARVPVRR